LVTRHQSLKLLGANRGAVNECKAKFGERTDWDKTENINIEDSFVIPVSFGKEHKSKC
jgi:hypothetical protein